MPPFRTLRRLLSRASQDWQDAVDCLFRSPSPPAGPRPLHVMRLERRRVLSADFSLTAHSLVLSGFDAADGESLLISQEGDSYHFTTEEGWNAADGAPPPEGVTIDGETLSVSRGLLAALPGGLDVQGDPSSSLNVRLGNADFSGLSGPVSLLGPSTVEQQPFALLTTPDAGLRMASAASGLTVGSLNVTGNLEVTAFGAISDAPGTQITVTGNATFVSRAFSPAGDFDGNGVVNDLDHASWVAGYGLQAGASKYDGDANGDGRVDAADYTAWRDSLGQTGAGGITLADNPGDRFEVLGTVTFDTDQAEGNHAIDVGSLGWTEFGAIEARGTQVTIREDSPSEILEIDAYNFSLTTAGAIHAGDGATVRVEDSATLTSLYRDFQADFNGDRAVDDDDLAIWNDNFGAESGATRSMGDANGDGRVDSADFVTWRDESVEFEMLSDPTEAIRGGITVDAGSLFEAGGLVTLVAHDGETALDRFDVTVDQDATARFGSVRAEGAIVTLFEDAGAFKPARDGNQGGSLIVGIDAQQLTLVSAGPITDVAGVSVRVGGGEGLGVDGDATLGSTASIELADSAEDEFEVAGLATLVAGPTSSIHVGVAGDGARAASAFNAAGLRYYAPGGEVLVAEASDTTLAAWTTGDIDARLPGATPTDNRSRTLELLTDGDLTDADQAVVVVSGDNGLGERVYDQNANATFIAGGSIRLADGLARNQLSIDGLATFIAGTNGSTSGADLSLSVGVAGGAATATFDAGRLRFAALGAVSIAEDRGVWLDESATNGADLTGTVLAGWPGDGVSALVPMSGPTASGGATLDLLSAGRITDQPNSAIQVLGDATFVVSGDALIADPSGSGAIEQAVVLADSGTVNELLIGGVATFIVEAPASNDPAFDGPKGIDVGVSTSESLGVQPANALFNAQSLRFSAPDATVRMAEDSSLLLHGWQAADAPPLVTNSAPTTTTAQTLKLLAAGSIRDATDSVVEITGNASFVAAGEFRGRGIDAIVLADQGIENTVVIEGLATLVVANSDFESSAGNVRLGAAASLSVADARFDAGSLRLFAPAGRADVAEDSATELAGWAMGSVTSLAPAPAPMSSEAQTLSIVSAGAITDSTDAVVLITGRDVAGERIYDPTATASFTAATNITLADAAIENKLVVDGLATFTTGDGDTLTVGVADDGLPAEAEFVAGSLQFAAPNGVARIAEDGTANFKETTFAESPGTLLTGSNEAQSLELLSAGAITDSIDAVISIEAAALFVASGEIVLADDNSADSANDLTIAGDATFLADGTITVGVADDGAAANAAFGAGAIRFASPSAVSLAEDDATVLAGWSDFSAGLLPASAVVAQSSASTLQVLAAGTITDEADAVVEVTGDASFVVSEVAEIADAAPDGFTQAIVLADAGAVNALRVGGLADFVVQEPLNPAFDGPKGVDVGVSSSGLPADATFAAGSLRFSAPEARVRIAEDDGVVLGAGSSQASVLQLRAEGAITDVDAAATLITNSAELDAQGGDADVVLGDGAAQYSMGSPTLFDPSMYLAINAANVSVKADSPVNIRTANTARFEDADFSGTYFLTATGSISQVGSTGGELASYAPLRADKISLASSAGVYTPGLQPTSDEGPNLQIKAGEARLMDAELSQALATQFASLGVPTSGDPTYAPILVEADDPVNGTRSGAVDRDPNREDEVDAIDEGFEDLFVDADGEERFSRVSEHVPGVGPEHALPDPSAPSQTRTIRDEYSAIVYVEGDAVVGDVLDPATGASHLADADDSRGFVVTSNGNGFLRTAGDLTFTSAGREGDAAQSANVAEMAGGVFTAVAGLALTIDTKEADQAAGPRTTVLKSATGAVTSVNYTDHGDPNDATDDQSRFGPRAILDPLSEEANAATSGLVRANDNFEQKISLAVGSRGEDNLLVEIEWADVADIRENSRANLTDGRDPDEPLREDYLDPTPAGSSPFADLTQTARERIELPIDSAQRRDTPDIEYQHLGDEGNDFRVATLRHNFVNEFVSANPARSTLPTTVRVYNDPAINLYDQANAVGQEGQTAARDLNSASFQFAPRIITLPPPGYTVITTVDPPREYIRPEPPPFQPEATSPVQLTVDDEGRAAVTSTAESVEFGRVDQDGEWLIDVPGEAWPQVRDDAEGDFLREIRDKIDEGPYSEGTYQIRVVTPRGEQLLEEWVKGSDTDGAETTGALNGAAQEADAQGLQDAEPAKLPQAVEAGPLDEIPPQPVEALPVPTETAPLPLGKGTDTSGTTHAAFAAVAAVGLWRRRLGDAGPFRLDTDGVAFTRIKRRRRQRGQ